VGAVTVANYKFEGSRFMSGVSWPVKPLARSTKAMGNYALVGNARLFSLALVSLTAIVLLPSGGASARVGVTSGADGDPLGKPPNENERILAAARRRRRHGRDQR
jgi:hypothetical protein